MQNKHEFSAGGIVFKQIQKPKFKVQNYLWLICQHSYHKGWVFPKGLIGDNNSDESTEDAALREVAEEGGVHAKIVSKLPDVYEYYYKHNNQLIKKTVHYFLMEYVSGDPADHDDEMIDARFVSSETVMKMLSYPSEKKAFEDVLTLMRKII